MRNYMKENLEKNGLKSFLGISKALVLRNNLFQVKKILISMPVFFVAILTGFCFVHKTDLSVVAISEELPKQITTLPMAATASKKATISIPSGTVKANPFLPYRDIDGTAKIVNDVPVQSLVEPPETNAGNPEAIRVMDTMVSGILYDKFDPSAILNIEGNDYLVKKGDVVNNYKVLAIAQDSVTVQLGSNIYKAGIGEILTEGSLNQNEVSNLSNKFGGIR